MNLILLLFFAFALYICDVRNLSVPPLAFLGAALLLLVTIRIPETRTEIVMLFLTIHIIFASLYTAAYKHNPASFSNVYANDLAREEHAQSGYKDVSLMFDMLYFSMVTFFTIGYGDIAPATKLARSLVMVEMLTAYGMTAAILIKLFED